MRCDPVSLPPGDAAAAAHGWGGWGLGMFRGLRENPILLQSQRKESKPFLSDSWNLSRKNNGWTEVPSGQQFLTFLTVFLEQKGTEAGRNGGIHDGVPIASKNGDE